MRGVSRKLAVRADETLADLHQLIQFAFEWDDDHLYSFWLGGTFWDRQPGTEYTVRTQGWSAVSGARVCGSTG